MTWWEWTLVVCVIVGIVYQFAPLAGALREAWDAYRHRRYMRRLMQDYAERKEKQMSESWRRTYAYDKDGDKVA